MADDDQDEQLPDFLDPTTPSLSTLEEALDQLHIDGDPKKM
jgi:hypothetical protein